MAVYTSLYNLDLDTAAVALDYINPNLEYRDWANIGRALASEFDDDAFDIFDNWSSTADNYKSIEVLSQWKSFLKSNSVNISTLIYHARQAGWKPEKSESISDDERARRKAERDRIQAERKAKAEKVTARKQSRSEAFYSNLPKPGAPSPYAREKGLADAASFSEFKEFHSKRKKGERRLMVLPLRDINGQWRGAEIIYAWHKFKDEKTGKQKHFKRLMKGTEPALGFHVFPNHDALATAKRIRINEGWADGAWNHKATEEVSVYVVGSHNIPVIAALIEQKYPNAQVIVAPDNDKAGSEAIDKHAGYWTQPTHENDWSDVAKNEGIDSLRAQLFNVRGYEKVIVNSRYLGDTDTQIKPGLNLIRSNKETGKSTWIIEFLDKNPSASVLVISYRKNLTNQLAKKAGVDYYENLIIKGDDPNQFLRKSRRLAISPDSIYKLLYKGTFEQKYDIVFIDECDQTIQHFNAEIMKRKEKNLGVMSYLLKEADYKILADADLSDITTEYCRNIQLDRGQYIINTYKPRLGSTMNLFKDYHHLRSELVQRALIEPVFYCSNSKDRVLEVQKMLIDSGVNEIKIQAIHADNSSKEEIRNFIVNVNEEVKDLLVLMASPSMGTGVSIDEGHPFKAVYAEFSHRTGTAEQAHQQMARTRGITEYNVWVDPAVNNFETDVDEIRRVMLDKPESDEKHLFKFDINAGEMVAKDELFEKVYCRNKSFFNMNRNFFAIRFLKQAEEEGYEIKTVAVNELAAEISKEQLEEIRERLKNELHERIFDDENNPILSDKELEKAKLGALDVSKESYLKTQVVKSLNLRGMLEFKCYDKDAVYKFINQLAFAEETNGFVSSIKKLSVLAQSKEIAILRDIEDRKFAESRANLKHFTAQRRHELRFLKAVGIDEQLNYNGKEWQSKDIKSSMSKYLAKYKDEIQVYSGSNITNKTLRDPVRWLKNHLKSMGVPLTRFQKRINGKQKWHHRVHEGNWQLITRLVKSRVDGLTKYYTEKRQELQSETVTREALIYNNNNCSHVTHKIAAIPVNTQLLTNSESAAEQKNFAPSETTQIEQSSFEKFTADYANQHGLTDSQAKTLFTADKKAFEAAEITAPDLDNKHRFDTFVMQFANNQELTLRQAKVLFPTKHRKRFEAGQITFKDLNVWAEQATADKFTMFVGELAMTLRKTYQYTLGLFEVNQVAAFNAGELSERELTELARSAL